MKTYFRKKSLTTAFVLSALICTNAVAFAQDNDVKNGDNANDNSHLQEFTLDSMVVTATRSEKRDVDVPASTTILTTADLKATGAQNLQVALGRVPGLTYKSFAPGGGAMGAMTNDVTIRGVDNGTLIMLNGSPMNLRGKYYLDAIPLDSIEKVEIIKGGSSVLYGSEAMGGVVNIITKQNYNNSVTVGMGNYGQRKYNLTLNEGKMSVGYNREKWGAVDDIGSAHEGTYRHTDLRDSAKSNIFLNYKFDDNWNFLYNNYQTDTNYNVWIDKPFGDVKKPSTLQAYRDYTTKQNFFQLTYQSDTVKGNIYYNQNKLFGDGFTYYKANSGELDNSVYDSNEKNRTYGADVQKRWDFNKGNFIFGTSYQNEFYDNYKKISTSRNIFATYGQYDYNFDDANEFIFGARETWTTGGYRDQNYDNFSMSGQFLHKLSDDDSIYASVSQSFIMPTFAQMYTVSDKSIANPDLKPQKGTNYEIGWKRVSDTHSWKAALYHMDITDNITASIDKNDDTKYQYTNEDFKNTGVELTCDITGTNGFSYNWGINYGDPKSKSTKKPYWDRKYGRLQLTGGINYNKGKWVSSLQGTYLAQRVETPTATHSYDEKPYFLTSLTTTYNADDQNSVTLSMDNILDRRDNIGHSGSNYYTTPFNFMLSYDHKF